MSLNTCGAIGGRGWIWAAGAPSSGASTAQQRDAEVWRLVFFQERYRDIIRTFHKIVSSAYCARCWGSGEPGRRIAYYMVFSVEGKQMMTKPGDVCCQGGRAGSHRGLEGEGGRVTCKCRLEVHTGVDQVKQENKSTWAKGAVHAKILSGPGFGGGAGTGRVGFRRAQKHSPPPPSPPLLPGKRKPDESDLGHRSLGVRKSLLLRF